MVKNYKYIFIFIFLYNFSVFAQNKKDTSFVSKLIKLSQIAKSEKDSLRMFISANKAVKFALKSKNKRYIGDSYFNLASCFYYKNLYLKSIKNYDKALFYYKKVKYNIGISKSFFDKANAYYHLNNIDSSLHFHILSFEFIKNSKNKAFAAKSANAVGLSYWRKGNNIKAIEYYKQSLDLRKNLDNPEGLSIVLNSLGAVYWGVGHYNTAHGYYLKALKIVDSLKLDRKYVLIKNNIGLLFQEWRQYDIALEYHLSAINRCKTINYNYGLAYSEINAGICYQHLNKKSKAKKQFKTALIHYKKTGDLLALSYANRVVGNFYLHTKQIEEALNHYSTAHEIAKKTGNKNHIAYAQKAIAGAYLELNNYKQSEKYALLSLKISKVENYRNLMKDNYYILAKIKEKNNDFEQALKYYKKASIIRDTISKKMLKNNILDLQNKYDSKKISNENRLLIQEQIVTEAELKAKHNLIVFTLIGLSLLGVFVLILFFSRKQITETNKLLTKKNKEINYQKSELKKANTALLKANDYRDKIISIIGHDIKAPIGTIKELVNLAVKGEIKGEKLQKLLIMLNDKANATNSLILDLFKWAKNQRAAIPFEPENIDISTLLPEIIKLLKEIADKKSIEIVNNVKKSTIVLADKKMLDTILRNLISNSIKFTNDNGKIIIDITHKNESITISIKDNGIGIEKEIIEKILSKDEFYSTFGTNEEKGSGLGLQLCIEFLKTHKSKLFVDSVPNEGSNFSFNLPLAKKL